MFCPNIFLTCCGFISVTRPIMLQSHNFWLQSGIRQSSFHDSHNSLEKVDKEKRSGKVAMKSERAKQCWIFALSMNSEQFNSSYIKEQMTDVLTSLSLWSIITIFLSVTSFYSSSWMQRRDQHCCKVKNSDWYLKSFSHSGLCNYAPGFLKTAHCVCQQQL